MKRCEICILILAVVVSTVSAVSAGTAPGVRFIPLEGPAGPRLETALAPSEQIDAPPQGEAPREYAVVWHRALTDAIYTTAGISAEVDFAGTYLNPPKQVEAVPIDGGGTPLWVFPGTEFYADASREGTILAALDATPADSTITVLAWQSGSSTPLWSYPIHPCRPLTADGWATGKGIQVSDDASTIAVVANFYTPNGSKGRLFIFESGSGIPSVSFPLDGTATALAITPDGDFAAVYAWPSIYVYDHRANAMRWSGSAYSGNDALSISADGRYIAWGWSNFYLREWNGSTYQPLWQTNHGSTYYVTECAVSRDGSSLAVAWYRNGTYDDNMIELYDLSTQSMLWHYNYGESFTFPPLVREAGGDRNPVEVISEIVFSPDSQLLAAASWGGTYPEIHLFDRSSAHPLVIVDTPGTMFDIDVASRPGGEAFVTAAGKHVHAGQAGRGGDFYSIWYAPGLAIEDGPIADGAPFGRIGPNPFRFETRMEVSHPGIGGSAWTIHDASGRRVANLNGTERDGSFVWTGTDDFGRRLPAGTYFVRLNARGRAWEGKVALLP